MKQLIIEIQKEVKALSSLKWEWLLIGLTSIIILWVTVLNFSLSIWVAATSTFAIALVILKIELELFYEKRFEEDFLKKIRLENLKDLDNKIGSKMLKAAEPDESENDEFIDDIEKIELELLSKRNDLLKENVQVETILKQLDVIKHEIIEKELEKLSKTQVEKILYEYKIHVTNILSIISDSINLIDKFKGPNR